MNRISSIIIFLLLLFFLKASAAKPELNFSGQVVAWTTASLENPLLIQPGARFVPTFTGKYSLMNSNVIDFEASANINGSVTFENDVWADTLGVVKPYRVWMRYSGEKFELRAGLQKINFGPAKMFRPLMWFDAMDIRDPLQLTDGVYGILGKYFFDNNGSVWLWSMAGNKQPKGFEVFGSVPGIPEFGGRFELPLAGGEVGFAYHHRTLTQQFNRIGIVTGDHRHVENRFGIHGRWDVEVGLWFEASASLIGDNDLSSMYFPKKTDMINIGLDYTVPVANGIGLTLEYFRYHNAEQLFTGGVEANVLGLMASYPLTLIDNISAMFFYLPAGSNSMAMSYLSWSRSWDNFSLYLMAFLNPKSYQLPAMPAQGRNMFAGKGLQVMGAYNF